VQPVRVFVYARNTNRTGPKLELTGTFFKMTGQGDKEGRETERERERERELSRLYSNAGSETGGYAKRMNPRDTAHRLRTFTSGRGGKLRARIFRVRTAAVARDETLRQYFAFDSKFVFNDIHRVFDNGCGPGIFSIENWNNIFSGENVIRNFRSQFSRALTVSIISTIKIDVL